MLKSLQILHKLRHPTGLFSAASKEVSTGYDKAWIRDNVYAAIGLEMVDPQSALSTYHALLDVFKKHEYKIDWAIRERPDSSFKYIHARFHPLTYDEFHENWGNKQNDSIGLFLFKVADLHKKGYSVIRSSEDVLIIQKLVDYLAAVEYWHGADNGIWEENEEVHASSVGACVAALALLQETGLALVPDHLLTSGRTALRELLPRESVTKESDLALLSLIYPLNVVSNQLASQILERVEATLVRERGVIRYTDDQYYSNGKEAEWCFGFPWLATIYKKLGDKKKYHYYMYKTLSIMNESGEIPELYLGGTDDANENTPLGWAQAMYLCALLEGDAESGKPINEEMVLVN